MNALTESRLFDLVRYQRHALHEADLITDDEYTFLLQEGSENGSVERLESYDQIQARLTAAEAERDAEKAERLRLEGAIVAFIDKWEKVEPAINSAFAMEWESRGSACGGEEG